MQEITTKEAAVARIKATACEVEGCRSFAELATVALARQFLKKGRRSDARRLVGAYLDRHPKTAKVAELVREMK